MPADTALFQHLDVAQHLLVFEDELKIDACRWQTAVVFAPDLLARPSAVKKLDDTPLGVIEVVVLVRFRIFHHPGDFAHLHHTANDQTGSKARSIIARGEARDERGAGHGSMGQNLSHRYRSGLRSSATIICRLPTLIFPRPSIPARSD